MWVPKISLVRGASGCRTASKRLAETDGSAGAWLARAVVHAEDGFVRVRTARLPCSCPTAPSGPTEMKLGQIRYSESRRWPGDLGTTQPVAQIARDQPRTAIHPLVRPGTDDVTSP